MAQPGPGPCAGDPDDLPDRKDCLRAGHHVCGMDGAPPPPDSFANWPAGHAVTRTADGWWFVCSCEAKASDPYGMAHAPLPGEAGWERSADPLDLRMLRAAMRLALPHLDSQPDPNVGARGLGDADAFDAPAFAAETFRRYLDADMPPRREPLRTTVRRALLRVDPTLADEPDLLDRAVSAVAADVTAGGSAPS